MRGPVRGDVWATLVAGLAAFGVIATAHINLILFAIILADVVVFIVWKIRKQNKFEREWMWRVENLKA